MSQDLENVTSKEVRALPFLAGQRPRGLLCPVAQARPPFPGGAPALGGFFLEDGAKRAQPHHVPAVRLGQASWAHSASKALVRIPWTPRWHQEAVPGSTLSAPRRLPSKSLTLDGFPSAFCCFSGHISPSVAFGSRNAMDFNSSVTKVDLRG